LDRHEREALAYLIEGMRLALVGVVSASRRRLASLESSQAFCSA
jgi:hypothetical protein